MCNTSLFCRMITAGGLVTAIFALLLLLGYSVIYKKILHGVKRVSPFHLFKIILLAFYIFSVLYVTVLDRTLVVTSEGFHFTGGTEMTWNLIPFSDFVFHEGQGLLVPIRYALLNIMMFIPLGLLLPVVSSRFHKGKNVILCAFFFSLFVEGIQLFSRVGIFELDDLLFNTLGAIVGWLLARAVFSVFGLSIKAKRDIGSASSFRSLRF